MKGMLKELNVACSAFDNGGQMPVQYTGRAEDISPELTLSALSEEARSIAIIMEDLDIPVIGKLTHWVIWNLPVQTVIPENIPHGETIASLGNAMQGIGYGRHRYKGPKPPFGSHRYQFHIYALDCRLDLSCNAGKKALIRAMEDHILQYGSITGVFGK